MSKLKRVTYQFKNELEETRQVVTLSGSVSKESFWDKGEINAKKVSKILAESDLPLTIRLNSPGGDVFEGIEIYNLLKASERHITVEVTALAASAASIIAMGADDIVMLTGANMMIHEASTIAWGTKTDIQKTLNALETIDQSILEIYVNRTGKSSDEIHDWLIQETWMTAQEAVENGFADRLEVEKIESDRVDALAMKVANMDISGLSLTGKLSSQQNKKLKIFGGKK